MSQSIETIWVDLFDHDIKLDATVLYQPAEAAETGPDAQYPGCEASVDVYQLSIAERDESFKLSTEDVKDIYRSQADSDDEEESIIIELDYVTFKITPNGTLSIYDYSSKITDLLE